MVNHPTQTAFRPVPEWQASLLELQGSLVETQQRHAGNESFSSGLSTVRLPEGPFPQIHAPLSTRHRKLPMRTTHRSIYFALGRQFFTRTTMPRMASFHGAICDSQRKLLTEASPHGMRAWAESQI